MKELKKILSLSIIFISSVFAFAEDDIQIKKITASSTLVEKGNAADFYSAKNLIDNSYKSWVEGKSDDGIGESVTFEFEKPLNKLPSIGFRNGYGDLKYYYANNRVKDISVTFNDDLTVKTTLKDRYDIIFYDLYNTYEYKKPISKVTIKIDSVYKGQKYSDTCLSEIFFKNVNSSRPPFSDPYSAELDAAYKMDIDKVLKVEIDENYFVNYLQERDEYDISMDGPGDPYWSLWNFRSNNIFVTSYSPNPFAIVQNQWTNNYDHDLSYNIDIYTYKNGKWIIDNQNPLYKNLRKIIDDAKKNGNLLRFRRLDDDYSTYEGFHIIDVYNDDGHLFNIWESLEEYIPGRT